MENSFLFTYSVMENRCQRLCFNHTFPFFLQLFFLSPFINTHTQQQPNRKNCKVKTKEERERKKNLMLSAFSHLVRKVFSPIVVYWFPIEKFCVYTKVINEFFSLTETKKHFFFVAFLVFCITMHTVYIFLSFLPSIVHLREYIL